MIKAVEFSGLFFKPALYNLLFQKTLERPVVSNHVKYASLNIQN